MHDEFDRLNTSQYTLDFELSRVRTEINHLAAQVDIEQLSQSVVESSVATLQSYAVQQQANAVNFTRTLQSVSL